MTLNEYMSIVDQYAEGYDYLSAVRSYQRYRRSFPDSDNNQACCYIQQLLPMDDMVSLRSVLSEYGTVSYHNVEKAQKWIELNGDVCKETLYGVYTAEHVAQKLRTFLNDAIPTKAVFEHVCTDIGIAPSQAMYQSFCHGMGKTLIRSRYHPFCADNVYWLGKVDDLYRLIQNWYMAYAAHIPSEKKGYISVCDSATAMGIKTEKLLDWLRTHESDWIYHCGRCLLKDSTVKELCACWESVQPVTEILKQKILGIPVKARNEVKEYLTSWLQKEKHDWILPDGKYPQQVEGVWYTSQPLITSSAIDSVINMYPTILINRLKDGTGMSLKVLRSKATSGVINAKQDERGNWYVSANEYNRVLAIQEQYTTLDEVVLSILRNTESTFELSSHVNRNQLENHCHDHKWWGIEYFPCKDLPIDGKQFDIALLREDAQVLTDRLVLWLEGHGQTYARKLKLIFKKYACRFPHTIERLMQYEQCIHPADKALIEMAESLCVQLCKELNELTDTEIEQMLIGPFGETESLTCCDILADFLIYAGYTKRRFAFSRAGNRVDVSAYPVKDYAVMLAYVVNDSVIKKSNLITKAVANKRYADLWLYVALHMYASWRSTDYIRMIAPQLPYSPEDILEKVENGELLPEEAQTIAEQFVAMNSIALNTPQKTQGVRGVHRTSKIGQ